MDNVELIWKMNVDLNPLRDKIGKINMEPFSYVASSESANPLSFGRILDQKSSLILEFCLSVTGPT